MNTSVAKSRTVGRLMFTRNINKILLLEGTAPLSAEKKEVTLTATFPTPDSC